MDDEGNGDLGCFGGQYVNTLRINQIGAEASLLTSFYMGGWICNPSRAAIITDLDPPRVGSDEGVLLAGDPKGLNPSKVTITEEMTCPEGTIEYSDAKGIGSEVCIMRRDLRDIIKVGELFCVWYSK